MRITTGLIAIGLLAAGCGEESGNIYLWAGNGIPGFDGDGKAIEESRLYQPLDLEFAPDGTPWVLDWNNHKIRKVVDGTFVTVIGTALPGDGDEDQKDLTPDGAEGNSVALNHPTDIQFQPDGTLFFAAWHNHKIRKVDTKTGTVKVVCGRGSGYAGDAGPAEQAILNQPKSIILAPDGSLFISDQRNFRIRKISAGENPTITTVVGDGKQGTEAAPGADGELLKTQLGFEAGGNPQPSGGLALDAAGNLYLSDSLTHRIRKADFAAGTITTIAGTGVAGFSGDGGAATAATLRDPRDLEIGPDGNLYVADTDNHAIRKIDLKTGVITTFVGNGTKGTGELDDLPTKAQLSRPFGLAFDKAGNLYVSDTMNNRILKVVK